MKPDRHGQRDWKSHPKTIKNLKNLLRDNAAEAEIERIERIGKRKRKNGRKKAKERKKSKISIKSKNSAALV